MNDYLKSIITEMLLDEEDTYSYMLDFHNNNIIYDNVLDGYRQTRITTDDGDAFSYYEDAMGHISPCGMYMYSDDFTIPIKDVFEIYYIDELFSFYDAEYSNNKIVLNKYDGFDPLRYGIIGEILTFEYPNYASLWKINNITKELTYMGTSPIDYKFSDSFNYPPEGEDIPGVITLFNTEIITYL